MNRNQSSIGLNHGAGKGDADRTSDVETFRRNFENIVFPEARGFVKTARGQRKVYGKAVALDAYAAARIAALNIDWDGAARDLENADDFINA